MAPAGSTDMRSRRLLVAWQRHNFSSVGACRFDAAAAVVVNCQHTSFRWITSLWSTFAVE